MISLAMFIIFRDISCFKKNLFGMMLLNVAKCMMWIVYFNVETVHGYFNC